ncbi:MAG: DUF2059 domain-containing protein [Chthoniobacteraceae bacterium]|nr:DUF2059 domain-containing protein [Chthoniobacteraceae bacterium]
MKKTLLVLFLAICASPLLSLAQDATAPARPDVEELLNIMRVEKTMQSAMAQVKKMVPQMTAGMAAQGKVSADDAAKATAMQEKILALVEQEMGWKNIKPEMVKIYADSLTPEEVKGITAFYKSPAGQAFLDKQPVIMEKTMVWQQKMMGSMMPKIQALVQAEIGGAAAK